MLNPKPFSPLVNIISSDVSSHIAVVLSGSKDFDRRLVSSVIGIMVLSEFKFDVTPTFLCMAAEAKFPVVRSASRFSFGEIADIPDIFKVGLDDLEEQGIDSNVLESLDLFTTTTFPSIWLKEEEFLIILSSFSAYSSTLPGLVPALDVEHEMVSDWLTVLHANETSDLAFINRSVSLEANKL